MKGYLYIIVINGWAKLAFERRSDAENYVIKSARSAKRHGLAIYMRVARFIPRKNYVEIS